MKRKPIDIARKYFPKIDVQMANSVIWNLTGFPGFFKESNLEEHLEARFKEIRRKYDNEGLDLISQINIYESEVSLIISNMELQESRLAKAIVMSDRKKTISEWALEFNLHEKIVKNVIEEYSLLNYLGEKVV